MALARWVQQTQDRLEDQCTTTASLDEKAELATDLFFLQLVVYDYLFENIIPDLVVAYESLCGGVFDETVTFLTLDPSEATLEIGDTIQLTPTIHCSNGTCTGALWWLSSDETIGSVDEDGLVTANGAGLAFVFVQSQSLELENVTATAEITVAAGSIRGRVWIDKNGNNTFEVGTDEPLANHPIGLAGPAEREVATDEQGRYVFEGLPDGDYTVYLGLLPEGVGWNQASLEIPVRDAAEWLEANFIGRTLGAIHGRVWVDRNGNDTFEPDVDEPLADHPVGLSGPEERTVRTDAAGRYAFEDLVDGDYSVYLAFLPVGVEWNQTSLDIPISYGEEWTEADFIGTRTQAIGEVHVERVDEALEEAEWTWEGTLGTNSGYYDYSFSYHSSAVWNLTPTNPAGLEFIGASISGTERWYWYDQSVVKCSGGGVGPAIFEEEVIRTIMEPVILYWGLDMRLWVSPDEWYSHEMITPRPMEDGDGIVVYNPRQHAVHERGTHRSISCGVRSEDFTWEATSFDGGVVSFWTPQCQSSWSSLPQRVWRDLYPVDPVAETFAMEAQCPSEWEFEGSWSRYSENVSTTITFPCSIVVDRLPDGEVRYVCRDAGS
jgi:hypothetical protein